MLNKNIQTQDLKELSTPEETVQVLKESYADPLKEIIRRKNTARKEGHYKNILFWRAVESILPPVKKLGKSELSVQKNDHCIVNCHKTDIIHNYK